MKTLKIQECTEELASHTIASPECRPSTSDSSLRASQRMMLMGASLISFRIVNGHTSCCSSFLIWRLCSMKSSKVVRFVSSFTLVGPVDPLYAFAVFPTEIDLELTRWYKFSFEM
eukprot:gene21910-biopygen7661